MNSEQSRRDPIDDFLSKGAQTEAPEELRLAIQRDTLAVVRRHRRLQRVVWLSGLAACYAAGALTMGLLKTSHRESGIATATGSDTGTETGSAPPAPVSESPKSAPQPETALALEWQALDSEERRPDLFRLAGDKYLLANDLQSATRCYKGALQGASDDELQITVNDNWL